MRDAFGLKKIYDPHGFPAAWFIKTRGNREHAIYSIMGALSPLAAHIPNHTHTYITWMVAHKAVRAPL